MNLTLVGAPLTSSGQVEELARTVTVHTDAGSAVRFDNRNVAHQRGMRTVLAAADDGSLRMALPAGSNYAFAAEGRDAAGNLLAYGTGSRVVTSASSNAQALQLSALLGGAGLAPRLPTNYVVPGQELDLMLSVNPPARPDLRVARSDFGADYQVRNGTALVVSEHGLRVRVGDRSAGDVLITGTATGLVPSAAGPRSGSVSAQLGLRFATALTVDMDPPQVSDLAFDPVRQAFTGVASDNLAVVGATLWDGPNPLATTDLDEAARLDLPVIEFPGGGTAFLTYLALGQGTHSLTLTAFDFAGNEGRALIDVTIP